MPGSIPFCSDVNKLVTFPALRKLAFLRERKKKEKERESVPSNRNAEKIRKFANREEYNEGTDRK